MGAADGEAVTLVAFGRDRQPARRVAGDGETQVLIEQPAVKIRRNQFPQLVAVLEHRRLLLAPQLGLEREQFTQRGSLLVAQLEGGLVFQIDQTLDTMGASMAVLRLDRAGTIAAGNDGDIKLAAGDLAEQQLLIGLVGIAEIVLAEDARLAQTLKQFCHRFALGLEIVLSRADENRGDRRWHG